MKKSYLLIVIFSLFYFHQTQAQWNILNSGTTAELRSAYFTNSQTGYVVGSDSFVHKTTDAGQTWNAIVSVADDTLRNIFFTDDTTGYAVGAKGHIIKTTDAGGSWTLQVSNTTNLLRSVYFPAHDTGYIAGGGGIILKTTDGGNSWIQQVTGTLQDLISIRFVNADTGYAVSSLSTFLSGLILKTTDGGAIWDTVYTNTYGFLSVFPAGNDSVVYAVGGAGIVVKSSDAGLNWTVQPTGLATTVNLRASFFISADTGYISGDLGSLFYTTDGGTNWASQTFPAISSVGLLGLYSPMRDTVYAVGTAGYVLRYSTPCALAAEPGQISGGTTVCESSTITYSIASVPNASAYTWAGPPGAVIASGQGDTLVTVTFGNAAGNISVTADNLCGASVPHMLTVTVNPLPSVPVISVNGPNLVSSAAGTYQWYFNNTLISGADQSAYIPLQNGDYTVVVTNAFGCSATSIAYTVVNAAIQEPVDNSILLVPSPFKDQFMLVLSQDLSQMPDKTLSLYDYNGRLLKSISLDDQSTTVIPCKELQAGVMLYELRSHNRTLMRGKACKY